MYKSRVISAVIATSMFLCNMNANAIGTFEKTYPDIYIQDKYVEFDNSEIVYIEDELYIPAVETLELFGSEVVSDEDGISEFKLHNLDIKISSWDNKLEYELNGDTITINDCIQFVSNENYIKLSSLDNILDINYEDFEKYNKINLRDYAPQSIEYDEKQWSKSDKTMVLNAESSKKGKYETLFITDNGLEVIKVRKYILWIIPWGYDIYVQDIDNKTYIKYVK